MNFPKPGSIRAKVLSYLLTGHSLDLPKAIAMWGHIRLSDAIMALRRSGHNIITGNIEVPDSSTEFGYYKLLKQPFKGTLPGTRVHVTKGANRGWFGTVEKVLPESSYPVTVKLSNGKVDVLPYDALEVVYAN